MAVQEVAAKISPRAIEIASKLLKNISPQLRNISNLGGTGASLVSSSATLADGGGAQAVFNTRNLLHGHLNDLNTLIAHLGEHATPDQIRALQQVIDVLQKEGGEITGQHGIDLVSVLGEIASQEPVPGVASALQEEASTTERVVEQVQQGQKLTPHETLRKNIRYIFEAEIKNKSGVCGLIAEAARASGFEPAKYIDKILDPKFMSCLENGVKGLEVNTESLTDVQKKCFSVAKWGVRILDYTPKSMINYLPMLSHALVWASPIVCHIPFIGKTYATMFPFLNEFLGFLGRFNPQAEEIKDAIGQIKGSGTSKK